MFCKSCQNLANAHCREAEQHPEQGFGPSSSPVMIHHATWASFQDAVSAGCHLCNLINEELFAEELLSEDQLRPVRLYWQAHLPATTPNGYLVFSPSITCRVGPRFYFVRNQHESADIDASLRLVEDDMPPEDRAFITTKLWLNDCLGRHTDYCGKDTGGYVPTRLIDVGNIGDSHVRLSTSVPTHEKYATLSHCWGKSQILTLTRAMMDKFRAGIQLDALPKTFRDAISFSRRLGLRYLWIDSLCIIQDSVDDWRKESVMMAEVYRNGVVNIAATAAAGGDDGLYYPSDEFHSKHLRVTFTRAIASAGTTENGDEHPPAVAPGEYFLLNSKVWQRGVDEAPLNTRGWVLQERLFSPRVIHFSRSQLFWQCGMDYRIGHFAYSNDRVGSFGKAHTNRDPRAFAQVLWRLKSMPKEQKDWFILEEAYLPWDEVVTTYTAQHLTKGEDKLIAVQALAKAMEEAVDDRYVAGLWEKRLVEDLLWACSAASEKVKYTRQTTWRAPTWSWASVDGASVKKATLPGRYSGRKAFEGESLVEQMEHFVEGYNGITTGQLRSARLQLKGRLLRSMTSWRSEGTLSDGHIKGLSMRTLDPRVRSFVICPDEWDWSANDGADYEVPIGMFLLPVGTHHAYKPNGTDPKPCIEGLLLRDLGQTEGPTFSRIGYFKVVAEPEWIEPFLHGETSVLTRNEAVSATGLCTLTLL